MYVVAFISRHYVSKPWPMHERQSYQARMLEEALPYFLPIRLDNSVMPGLRPTLGYIDAKAFTPSAIVDMLVAKLDGRRGLATQLNITAVPRTRAQLAELLAVRPGCWAMLYFGCELLLRRDALRYKYLDHELRYAEKHGETLDHVTASTFLAGAFDEALEAGARLEAMFRPELLEKAFGTTGMSGDPERLAHLASRTIRIYETLLDWAARIRSARAPEDLIRAFDLAAQMMDVSLENTHQFVERYIAAAEEAKADYDHGTEDVHLRLRLEWDVDEALSAELRAELRRVRRRRKRWFRA